MKKIIALAAAGVVAVVLPIATAGAHAPQAGASRAASVSGLDEQYLTTSMQGDLFEIQGGKLAERKSRNAAVLRLARTLIRDHAKSFDDASRLARRLGIQVPTDPMMSQQWELKMVASLRGRTFNHWYSSLEAMDHEQDISEATDEVNKGKNAEVRRDARRELPMLHRHLNLSRAAMAASK